MDPTQYSLQTPEVAPQQLPPLKKNRSVLIAAVAGCSLAVIFLALFIWQFSQYNSLKNNYNNDVETEVNEALSAQETGLREDFESQLVADTTLFDGPDVLGDVRFSYPKTWSVYVESSERGKERLKATIHPVAVTSTASAFALKVSILDSSYADEVTSYQNEVEDGDLKSKPVTYSGVNGVRLDGLIDRELEGSLVLLPIRDKTLIMRTESTNYSEAYKQALETLQFTP